MPRLALESISPHTLPGVELVHRYELAAELCRDARVLELCCGVGHGTAIVASAASLVRAVDVDAAAVDAAGQVVLAANVVFEAVDARDALRRCELGQFDAVLLLQGLGHLADLEGLARDLRRLAAGGVRVILYLPSGVATAAAGVASSALRGDGLASEESLAESLGEVQLLYQFAAEGSLIRDGTERAGAFPLRGQLDERGEPDWASGVIALVNFPAQSHDSLCGGLGHLTLAPLATRRLHELERANAQLWLTNARLGRERLGQYDTAAATTLARIAEFEQRALLAEQRAAAAELRAYEAEQNAGHEWGNADRHAHEVRRLQAELAREQSGLLGRLRRVLRALRAGA